MYKNTKLQLQRIQAAICHLGIFPLLTTHRYRKLPEHLVISKCVGERKHKVFSNEINSVFTDYLLVFSQKI